MSTGSEGAAPRDWFCCNGAASTPLGSTRAKLVPRVCSPKRNAATLHQTSAVGPSWCAQLGAPAAKCFGLSPAAQHRGFGGCFCALPSSSSRPPAFPAPSSPQWPHSTTALRAGSGNRVVYPIERLFFPILPALVLSPSHVPSTQPQHA